MSLFFRFNVKHESIDILAYNNDKKIEVSSIIDHDDDKVKFVFHPPELGVFHVVDVLICGRSISEISRLTQQNFFDPTHIVQKVCYFLFFTHLFLTLDRISKIVKLALKTHSSISSTSLLQF